MNFITLRKGGIYAREYDEETGMTSLSKLDGPIGLYLQSVIELEDGVTAEDLMEFLIRNEPDINVIFCGSLRMNRLRPFYDEMIKPETTRRDDISCVEVGWAADYYSGDGKDGIGDIELYVHVGGLYKEDGSEIRLACLSQIGMNEWKHLPIVMSNVMSVYEFKIKYDQESGRSETDVINLLEARRSMTLYDFLCGFLETISMYGYPEQREERMKDIDSIISDVTNEGYEEYQIEDKEYELGQAIESEDYERASILKKQIDNMKKNLEKS